MTKQIGTKEYAEALGITIPGLHKMFKRVGVPGMPACTGYVIIGRRILFTVDDKRLKKHSATLLQK